MIYGILSIPFLAAFLYYFSAVRIQKKCFRTMTEEERAEFLLEDIETDEIKVFDSSRAGKWLAVMSVCWFLGYPIIQLHKRITE